MRFILFLYLIMSMAIHAHTNDTSLGRLQVVHPDQGHEGGAVLHGKVAAQWSKVSNNINTRYQEYAGIANGATVTYTHNLGVLSVEMCVRVFSGSGSSLTRISDLSAWTITDNVVNPSTKIDVTVPSSGGPFTFALVLSIGDCKETFLQLEDTPSSYTGQANKMCRVNATTDGVDFGLIVDANIDSSAGITRTKLATGTANHVIINNGSGQLSSESLLNASRGGTGANLSSASGIVKTSSGVMSGSAALDDVNDVDLTTVAPEDGQALVYDGGNTKWKAGASGDSSFKLQSFTNTTLTIKSGKYLYNGNNVVTWYAAGGTETLKLSTDLTYTPTGLGNSKYYYIYADLSLATLATLTNFTRQVYQVEATDFTFSETAPNGEIDNNRYMPIGMFKTDSSGIIVGIDNDPQRYGDSWKNVKLYNVSNLATTSATVTNLTGTTTTAKYRQEGAYNYYSINIVAGTDSSSTGSITITLPHSIDTAALVGTETNVGTGSLLVTDVTYQLQAVAKAADGKIYLRVDSTGGYLTRLSPVTIASGNIINVQLSVPILGQNAETTALSTPNNSPSAIYSADPTGSTTDCVSGYEKVLENAFITGQHAVQASYYDASDANAGWQQIYLDVVVYNGYVCGKSSSMTGLDWASGDQLRFTAGPGAKVSAVPESFINKGKNYLINGNFDVWQRGTTAASGGYLADRWNNTIQGGSAASTISKQTAYLSAVPFTNFHRNVITNGGDAAGGYISTYQPIEDVTKLAGRTVTISFWAKADTAKPIAIEMYQYYGSGGSPSSIDFVTPQQINITTTWTKYTLTRTLASIEGKTLGTDGKDATYFHFWYSSGTSYATRSASLPIQTGTFDIAQVKLEIGSEATPFEPKTYVEELRDCQRYYYRHQGTSNPQYTSAINFLTNSTSLDFTFPLPVPMRVPPVISIGGTRGSAWTLKDHANNINTSGTFVSVGRSSTVPEFDFGTGSFTTTARYYIKLESTSGYIDASAEL